MSKPKGSPSAPEGDRLLLVMAPENAGDADILASVERAAGASVVGVIVREGRDFAGEESDERGLQAARLRDGLLFLTNEGRRTAVEIKVLATKPGEGDDEPHTQSLTELWKALRNDAVHGTRGLLTHGRLVAAVNILAGDEPAAPRADQEVTAALSSLPLVMNWEALTDKPTTKVNTAPHNAHLLDALIESTRAQLILLNQMRSATAAAHREQVELDTPRGPVAYTLPFSRSDTYDSAAVGEILSPTGKTHRSIAQHRRRANELLGVKVGNQYLHPKFQIDPVRHEIRPIVSYANRALECDADPWGALDWWYSEDEALDGRRPVDMLDTGELSETAVDFAIARASEGMD
jgi:hypothetical protein